MKNLSKNFVWALVILMVLSALYSGIAGQFQEKGKLSLSAITSITTGPLVFSRKIV